MRQKLFLSICLCTVVLILPLRPSLAQTPPSANLQALVRQLQEQITTLQFQVQELKTQLAVTQKEAAATKQEVAEVKEELRLTRSLKKGERGDDVRKLQEFLSQFSDIYPQGLVTGFYGPATEAAVRKLQAKHGIEQLGFIGPRTLAKINELIMEGAGTSGVIPPGLLRAPGIRRAATATTTPPEGVTPQVPPSAVGAPAAGATSSPLFAASATSTPADSASISAVPAQSVGQTGTTTVSAISAASAATSTAATTTATATFPVLKITGPNGGEQWIAGNTYTIAWTSAGKSVATVNVDIYKAGSYHASVAYETANTGNVVWMAPATMLTGADYKIRVYSNLYYNNFDESDGAFSISVPVAAPSAPPIGYWKFDGSGANDIVGGPGAVTVGGAAFQSSGGKFGGYLYMPTGSDYAKIPYHSMFDLQNFTVEFWFRQRANQGFNQNLIYKGTPVNNYNFNIFRNLWNQFNNGPVIAGSTAAGTGYWHQVSNNNEPPHNAWHHVAYTKTTEGAAYYIDGVLIHSRNYAADKSPEYAGPVKTPATDIIIGNPAPDTDIDNLRIYNYSLSRGEVLYNWENIPGAALPVQDTMPPVISGVQATAITATSAVITWITDEPSDSQVSYDGPNTTFSVGTTPDTIRVTSHAVPLSGLTSSAAYTYRVKSKDAAGNLATNGDQTFTTFAAPSSAIADFTATVSSGYNVLFTWKDNSGIGSHSDWRFKLYGKPQGGPSTLIYKPYSGSTSFTYYYHPQGTHEYYLSLCNDVTGECRGTSSTIPVQVNSAAPYPQCTGLTLAATKPVYTVGEFISFTASCIPVNGRAVNISTRRTLPNGLMHFLGNTTNANYDARGISTDYLGVPMTGTYRISACLEPECMPSPAASIDVSVVNATTSRMNVTASQLAEILASLQRILASLKGLR